MTDRPDLMRRIREALADLYDNLVSARRVADDIGLDATQIVTVGVLRDVWHSILREAERQGKVEELLALALREYPKRADLAALADEYRSLSAAPQQPASDVSEAERVTAEATPSVARKPPSKRVWLLLAVVPVVVAIVVGLVVRSQIGGPIAPSPTATRAAVAQVTQTSEPQAGQLTAALPVATAAPSPTATPEPEAGATAVGPNEMVLVYIPAGSFLMGSSADDPFANDVEKPQREVNIDGFWVSRTEVTNAQYLRCVEAGACPAPRNEEYKKPELENRPVIYVSWYDANAYARWVGGRLPTEAEWEKACRGTDGRIYSWGNEAPTAELLDFDNNVGRVMDVGSYPPGAYGLFDMAGNVWEWTASLNRPYPYRADDGREDPKAAEARVWRGGSYDSLGRNARCASRTVYGPDIFYNNIGFRVVVSLSSSGS